jgi:hypothetical protein
MSEQLNLDNRVLPPQLVVTLAALELRAGLRGSILSATQVVQGPTGKWWIQLLVDGRRPLALIDRVDLEVAAHDLFHLIHHQAPPGDA